MANIGYTFEPGRDQKRMLGGINQGRLGPQANEALRVLSLRLPQVLGGSPISPEDLLRPRVGGAAPSGAVLQSLQRLTGGGASTPAPSSFPTSGAVPSSGSALNVASFPISRPTDQPVSSTQFSSPPPTITPGETAAQPYQPPTYSPGPVASQPADLSTLLRLIASYSTGPLTQTM